MKSKSKNTSNKNLVQPDIDRYGPRLCPELDQTATSYAYHARGRGAGGGSEGDLTDVHTDYIMGPCPPRAPGGGKSDGQIHHIYVHWEFGPKFKLGNHAKKTVSGCKITSRIHSAWFERPILRSKHPICRFAVRKRLYYLRCAPPTTEMMTTHLNRVRF